MEILADTPRFDPYRYVSAAVMAAMIIIATIVTARMVKVRLWVGRPL